MALKFFQIFIGCSNPIHIIVFNWMLIQFTLILYFLYEMRWFDFDEILHFFLIY
jgi:hypothetical protein